jgi:Stress responsive A/B Barrel Domain
MIYHYNRLSLKPDVSDAEREAAFANWHEQGRVIKAVESFSIGQDIGGEFEYAAVFVIKDIEGYKEYMSPDGRDRFASR